MSGRKGHTSLNYYSCTTGDGVVSVRTIPIPIPTKLGGGADYFEHVYPLHFVQHSRLHMLWWRANPCIMLLQYGAYTRALSPVFRRQLLRHFWVQRTFQTYLLACYCYTEVSCLHDSNSCNWDTNINLGGRCFQALTIHTPAQYPSSLVWHPRHKLLRRIPWIHSALQTTLSQVTYTLGTFIL